MNLKPHQAQKLANILLDSHPGLDPDPLAESHAAPALSPRTGRLAPGPFGRYRITRLVGIGGMGEVYEAEQENPARKVAIKVVRPELVSPEVLRRFEHESRVLARLQHPGIAPIYEAGQVRGEAGESGQGESDPHSTPFFAMEFVDGTPLTSFATSRKLVLKARLELFLHICDAVEHAHRKGVIHRDLKPANLLVDSAGRPRVMDFGLARATDADIRATTMHTEIGKLIGTLPYMSPEQVSGDSDSLDTRSDVYSLGVVLYELLGGRLPYAFKSDGRMHIPAAVRAIQESEPTPLSSIDRMFRGDLDTIVGKALAKEKDRRYQSVGELAADIRRYLNDEPIVARRAGTWYQVKKFARRNRGTAFAAIALVFALVLAASVSAWFAVGERRAHHRALGALVEAEEARNIAEQREQEARDQQITADALTKFAIRTFYSASPQRLGREVKLVDALDSASQTLEETLSNEPLAHAKVRHSLGQVFREVYGPERAHQEFTRSRELFASIGMTDSQWDLEVQMRLGETILGLGNYDAAEQMARELYEKAAAILGPRHHTTLGALNIQARTYLLRQDFPRALPLIEEVFEGSLETLGPEHEVTAAAFGGYIAVLTRLRRYEEAEPLLRQHLAELTAKLGEDAQQLIKVQSILAEVLIATGRLDEAEVLVYQSLESSRRHHGDVHAVTDEVHAVLIRFLTRSGRQDEAIQELRVKEINARALFGPEHPQYLIVLTNLGSWLARRGDFEEALPMLDRAYHIQSRLHGPESPAAVSVLNNTVSTLVEHARYDQAEPMLELLLSTAAAAFPPDDWRLHIANGTVGMCHAGLGQYARAEEHLLSAWRGLEVLYGPTHPQVIGHLRRLVQLYTDWGRQEDLNRFEALLNQHARPK